MTEFVESILSLHTQSALSIRYHLNNRRLLEIDKHYRVFTKN